MLNIAPFQVSVLQFYITNMNAHSPPSGHSILYIRPEQNYNRVCYGYVAKGSAGLSKGGHPV